MRNVLVTEAQYQQLLDEQRGLCAICEQPETHQLRGRTKPLAVDHDHRNGIVRGLLCHNCNVGLGMFKDNPDTLRDAADHLEHHDATLRQVMHEHQVDTHLKPITSGTAPVTDSWLRLPDGRLFRVVNAVTSAQSLAEVST